ncbi:uncharacterized protein LOC119397241 [Rhipicephalus sanguineus]|uniref:uncharacterized protein LOC119397241 n=1 Tax=Rhipicephalus sanguineus TaxID=34632 RepID=UPI0020C4004D|nr:uncharacterized protein LOC119397241 [Rhipicephalus sanguineus]
MGALLQVYREVVGPVPPAMPPPPPTVKPLTVTTDLGRLSKRRSPTCALQQAVASKLEEELAETAGLHLAVDLLAADPPTCPVTVACDSRAALQAVAKPEWAGFGTQLLVTKLHALLASGVDVSLHWVPSHVGIQGNEQADALAKEAHHSTVAVCRAVVASDYSRLTLRRLLLRCHPDERVARLLCVCPTLQAQRAALLAALRRQGIPAATQRDLLFPAKHHTQVFKAVLRFLEDTGLANRL